MHLYWKDGYDSNDWTYVGERSDSIESLKRDIKFLQPNVEISFLHLGDTLIVKKPPVRGSIEQEQVTVYLMSEEFLSYDDLKEE